MKLKLLSITALALCLTLLCGGLSACGSPSEKNPANEGVLNIVCTNNAAFDLARSVMPAEDAHGAILQIYKLGRPGQDMHSYESSPQDIVILSNADMVVSVGDVAEPWLADALSASGNKTVRQIKMMEVCGIEGEAHGQEHHEDCDLDHDHSELTDEHVWLSLTYAQKIASAIADTAIDLFKEKNPTLAEGIAAQRDSYVAELAALDEAYAQMVSSAKRTELMLVDRYPFVHLMHDYGLTCHAAFPGCSSSTDISTANMDRLIKTTQALGLRYIFVIEGSNRGVAETIAAETDTEILVLHSYQILTEEEFSDRLSYTDVMRANLENLRKALCE